jgi:hypothetical protein
MDNDRKSKSPVTFYGSGSYALLCFGKSRRTPFSMDIAANVLAGKFRRTSDARHAARRLEKHGLLENVHGDMWVLTSPGYEAIDNIADNYRKLRARLLGKTYMENKLREIRVGASTSIDGFMDDEILEEIYMKTMLATKKKSAKRRGKI